MFVDNFLRTPARLMTFVSQFGSRSETVKEAGEMLGWQYGERYDRKLNLLQSYGIEHRTYGGQHSSTAMRWMPSNFGHTQTSLRPELI